MTASPVLLHIPHSSTCIPDEYLGDYCVSPEILARENLRLADLYTDEIYCLPEASSLVFPVSRFLVDAERFSDDNQESMAQRGMGVLYKVDTDLNVIRPDMSAHRRQELMDRYYWAHHNRLDEMVARILKEQSHCLFIDCHSYPSKALPYELANMALSRPQIGIGMDSFHTPKEVGRVVATGFSDLGYEVGLDTPFSGTLVPNCAYGQEKRVMSFMIEIRKDLYMDEKTGLKLPSFDKVKNDVTIVMRRAAEYCRSQYP
ncbi:MAG: hypothetical protein DI586_03610 [Micavibrio aeruginosavorus]|uniref:N-formylglutamate amidohydrolase n=1 Tax=Micavibrio aeruginosavorus TaxID=349221 RepID=A0A2W5HS30_9BACT|nr:MAG: hypothetical protein DI586_03610 [Micavibrio aeruginosavorus]